VKELRRAASAAVVVWRPGWHPQNNPGGNALNTLAAVSGGWSTMQDSVVVVDP